MPINPVSIDFDTDGDTDTDLDTDGDSDRDGGWGGEIELPFLTQSVSVSVSVSKRNSMALSHERLDVYRLAIRYVAWVFDYSESLHGVHRHARDQWLRASQSIPLNIAEGNGKVSDADRRRYFEIARGSALECAAIQDVLFVGRALDEELNLRYKKELDRVVAMLSGMGKRGYAVREDAAGYAKGGDTDGDTDIDGDTDTDTDGDGDGDRGGVGRLNSTVS